MTGGWRSQGMIFVRDRHGGKVGIYVGRFNKIDEWGPLLLQAAERSGADVDRHSRGLLSAPHLMLRSASRSTSLRHGPMVLRNRDGL
jgi:hypothetical protein